MYYVQHTSDYRYLLCVSATYVNEMMKKQRENEEMSERKKLKDKQFTIGNHDVMRKD